VLRFGHNRDTEEDKSKEKVHAVKGQIYDGCRKSLPFPTDICVRQVGGVMRDSDGVIQEEAEGHNAHDEHEDHKSYHGILETGLAALVTDCEEEKGDGHVREAANDCKVCPAPEQATDREEDPHHRDSVPRIVV